MDPRPGSGKGYGLMPTCQQQKKMADDLTNCKAVGYSPDRTKQHLVGMSRFHEYQEVNL